MKLYLKFDSGIACKKIIQEQLKKINMQFIYLEVRRDRNR